MKFVLTSTFGMVEAVRNNKPHTGIDLAMPKGTELHSVVNGIVDKVFDGSTSIGKGVKIHGADGTDYIWGHMDKVDIHQGSIVHKGELLGLSGSTGNSTGPHLHFAEMQNGHYINPIKDMDLVQNMSGKITNFSFNIPSPLDLVGKSVSQAGDAVKETAREHFKNMILDFLGGLQDVVLMLIDNIALVGSASLILLSIVGYKKGYSYASILLMARLLIKLLLGGYI